MPLLFAPDLIIAQAAPAHGGWLTNTLLQLTRGGAEWVLWLLLIMLVGVLVVFFERLRFLQKVRVDAHQMRAELTTHIRENRIGELLQKWDNNDAMEARVLRYGLQDADRGPEAVLQLCAGAIGTERLRYEKRLSYLATVGSNAPFVGLFGTVMGVILAFDQLQGGGSSGAGPNMAIMGVIAEALIATGVGLLVAIPAIVFYNILKLRVTSIITQTRLLAQTAAAFLRSASGGESTDDTP